jgi:hypothetical protein
MHSWDQQRGFNMLASQAADLSDDLVHGRQHLQGGMNAR